MMRRGLTNYFLVILILNLTKCFFTQEVLSATERVGIEQPSIITADSKEIKDSTVSGIAGESTGKPEDSLPNVPVETEAGNDNQILTESPAVEEEKGDSSQKNTEKPLKESSKDSESSNTSASGSQATEIPSEKQPSEEKCLCNCTSGELLDLPCNKPSDGSEKGSGDNEMESNAPTDKSNVNAPSTESETPPPCTQVGNFPDPTDCQRYYSCVASENSEELIRIEHMCPNRAVFSETLGRCTRDISSCADTVACTVSGNFPDPNSNSSYYWCVENLLGGFHKYHIQCGPSEIFLPEIAKCFIDFEKIGIFSFDFGAPFIGVQTDRDVVKAEWKLIKAEEKAEMKKLKLKEKFEKKLEEEIAKKLLKDAKKQSSDEVKQFLCVEEGNFPSAISKDRYFVCVSKKGKFKAIAMNCPLGTEYDVERGACTLVSTPTQSVGGKKGEDTDDDDD